jgi:hypothetical protein
MWEPVVLALIGGGVRVLCLVISGRTSLARERTRGQLAVAVLRAAKSGVTVVDRAPDGGELTVRAQPEVIRATGGGAR